MVADFLGFREVMWVMRVSNFCWVFTSQTCNSERACSRDAMQSFSMVSKGTVLKNCFLKMSEEVSGDTLFHLASLTPLTSTPTFPSKPSLTSLRTTDSFDKLSQYNFYTSTLPTPHSLQLCHLTTYFLFPFTYHISYSFHCRYTSITTLLSPTILWS